jgi:hypothetical protein
MNNLKKCKMPGNMKAQAGEMAFGGKKTAGKSLSGQKKGLGNPNPQEYFGSISL